MCMSLPRARYCEGGHSSTALGPPRMSGSTCSRAAGCTLTVAVLSGDVLTLANVGDSTAILDTGAEVVQLTAGAWGGAAS